MRYSNTNRQPAHSAQRGVALLMVLIGVAILSLVLAELQFSSNVDIKRAANLRDSIRAHYQAQSAVNWGRLVLKLQRQLDGTASGLASIPGLSQLMPGGMPKIQAWRLLKPSCDFEKLLFPQSQQGDAAGCFELEIQDEEEKINLALVDSTSTVAQALYRQYSALTKSPVYTPLFESNDAFGDRTTADEVLLALRDWVDADETAAALALPGALEPFEPGLSSESGLYARYTKRYKPKNAKFESLDELYLAKGVTDRFMAAFGDKLTVYPDASAKLNINTRNPMLLQTAVLSLIDPTKAPLSAVQPTTISAILENLQASRMLPGIGMTTQQFINTVRASGLPLDPAATATGTMQRLLSDTSQTFTLIATGNAGVGKRELRVVLRLDDQAGRLLHVRED